ncbi:hypothetical protein A7D17_16250 [Xanthomonas floridensis]|uniref:DUF3142 domain-containing protein n=1 Tax=Xanthomonas floridensis TaxID=1843580 RepID=A0A1A9MD43_9XANT|nr:hypothetical protein A7D17_16250 [Xanthomonas floridensis]
MRQCALLLALCATTVASAAAAPVDARHYDAFWLWAGVRPQPVLAGARRVYLLQAEVPAASDAPARLVAQRAALPRLRHCQVWMVLRVERLDWTPALFDAVLLQLRRWRAAGNAVVGLQIDFDAGTRQLERYVAFLRTLRARLPADYQLGITGLLDWSVNGRAQTLDALGSVVDEVVLQIYQGRAVIADYPVYVARLGALRVPFRIGLLQDGEWQAPPGLLANPAFRGYVVFLRNR